ncbi:phage terminase small subunit P27 family [Rhodospirillum sp. A1_3_36]|uniref:phage terminase small subunit P27 family n=1 Tax=Rhodospirillum sp. A1_3_36 TaxID=3391666 RepID=UPI0039A72809
MARGRKPELAAIEGGLSKAAPAPSWLPDDAKKEWRRVMPGLARRRVLAAEDLATLENYCLAVGQIREGQRDIATQGRYVKSAEGVPRPHPAMRVIHTAMTQARQLAGELGLTPVARARMGTGEKATDDGWGDLVDG